MYAYRVAQRRNQTTQETLREMKTRKWCLCNVFCRRWRWW